jgi:tRNA (guanine-N7-)-methyltransferase
MQRTQQDVYQDLPELKRVEVPREDQRREVKSYVLRSGYLHASDLQALKAYFPTYGIPYRDGVTDFSAWFPTKQPLCVEIGFGMGDATLRIAKERPSYNYLGLEVFLTGFARLMRNIGDERLSNIRLMRFDAVTVLRTMVADSSVSGFHIFFPDPWQKHRQQKRRLIQPPFAELLCKKLVPGGYIYCVTDWEAYAEQMLEVFGGTPALVNPYGGYAESRAWRPKTHFEEKGLAAQRPIREIWVEKR